MAYSEVKNSLEAIQSTAYDGGLVFTGIHREGMGDVYAYRAKTDDFIPLPYQISSQDSVSACTVAGEELYILTDIGSKDGWAVVYRARPELLKKKTDEGDKTPAHGGGSNHKPKDENAGNPDDWKGDKEEVTPPESSQEELNEALRTKYEAEFCDIAGHWAEADILWSLEKKLFQGVNADRFAPESDMTRGMVAEVLYRLEGRPEAGRATFSDVNAEQYYYDAVGWAYENGIASGMGDEEFAPEECISRQQLAVILYRYDKMAGMEREKTTSPPFTDSKEIAQWAKEAVTYCAETGLLLGRPDGSFDPEESVTRAEMACVMRRL